MAAAQTGVTISVGGAKCDKPRLFRMYVGGTKCDKPHPPVTEGGSFEIYGVEDV